jgi:hypothetical protein
MNSHDGNFNCPLRPRAAPLWETSSHTMSDRNAQPSLTLRDKKGLVVSSINAGYDSSDTDSRSVVRRKAANHNRSRSPKEVQIRYVVQPPRPPREPPQPPPPSLPIPALQAWEEWNKAQPSKWRSRTSKPPPPPSQIIRASPCSPRPQLRKTPSVPIVRHGDFDREKKLERKEKCNSAVAFFSTLSDKKALWKKRLSEKARKDKACRNSESVAVETGARVHKSPKNTKASLRIGVPTTDSGVSTSPSASVCTSEASVPSVSASLETVQSEDAAVSPNAPKSCPQCRKTQFPEIWRHDFWFQVQDAYTVEKNGRPTWVFGDGIKGWAGMPETGKLQDGVDTSQVNLIKTKEEFYDPSISLSSTLFFHTPHVPRRAAIKAIENGLETSSLRVYFWRTAAGGLNKQLGIQCNHCDYTVHGSWTKKCGGEGIERLARLFCGFLVPSAEGIAHLPTLPLQH